MDIERMKSGRSHMIVARDQLLPLYEELGRKRSCPASWQLRVEIGKCIHDLESVIADLAEILRRKSR